ncbi:MAG: hypothetical protein ACHREM_04130 [Polyangiales bacterium]
MRAPDDTFDSEWGRARFVTKVARLAADAATDALSVDAPMSTFLDTWFAAYRAAGGVEIHPKRRTKP